MICLKKESYGRYTCVLDYLGTGRVEWNVYLNEVGVSGSQPHGTVTPRLRGVGLPTGGAVASRLKLEQRIQHSPRAVVALDLLLHLVEDEQREGSGCSSLLVPQNASALVDRSTPFWCYAKNEISVSGVRWPQDHDAPECSV
ncbi:Plasma membrane calcium-transporting ATPase 1 [Echinococcus multilocularis]|uniref:Plasma membrane calcium-transporting ATPase 1 n=1 Tax=Echinococcus multilocularis TaxID=6211 RepID=A0A0S4MKD4_ECHMU|nr:Plasma membrane calcium-transporting ATPase 1 [Echinococcus multilocularis]